MANQSKKLDKLFEEKLSQHNVQPSKLAWERLEAQLPKKQEKKPTIIWWAAAAVIAVGILSYSLFQTSDQTSQPEFVAQGPVEKGHSILPENQSLAKAEVSETTEEPKAKSEEKIITPAKEPMESNVQKTAPSQMIAMKEEPVQTVISERVAEEVTPIELPTIAIDRPLISEAKIDSPTKAQPIQALEEKSTVEEPTYKVTIISDGIKDEKDKKLIAGIGKRVNQVEGLLGSLDEGFGELQEAKNNLFASLISKKERTSEKPQ